MTRSTTVPDLTDELVARVRAHRCYHHPMFEHWLESPPSWQVIAAFFHHMQNTCGASRPGWSFEEGLAGLGADTRTLRDIVASEENHGPHLATMAGFLINRAAGRTICPDLYDQEAVEAVLLTCSRRFFRALPGYDADAGLLRQDRRVAEIYGRRKLTDRDSTYRNIGTLVATEMIASGHVFPGELRCLYESGLYGARREDVEMEYLFEHAGPAGAEAWHADTAIAATREVLSAENCDLVTEGADDILEALAAMWDILDAALLLPDRAQKSAAAARHSMGSNGHAIGTLQGV
jgi:hypothetical protein